MSLCKAIRDLQPKSYDLTAYKCMQSLLYGCLPDINVTLTSNAKEETWSRVT